MSLILDFFRTWLTSQQEARRETAFRLVFGCYVPAGPERVKV